MQYPTYYDTVLEMFESGYLQKDIADFLGIKKEALAFQMKKFGFSFKRDSYRLSDSEIDEIVALYSQGHSTVKISSDLGFSKSTVRYALISRGVTMKTKKEVKFYGNYSINEKAFEDLSTEESAYFYGWLLTDGWVSKANVSIELSRKDEELLLNFKTYMNSSNEIHRRSKTLRVTNKTYEMSSFGFSHEPVLARLKQLGLKEKKSLEEVCPETFQHNRHFWRGVVEGDGHIAKSGSYSVEICGGEVLIDSFVQYCHHLDPEMSVYKSLNGKMYVAKVGRKSSTQLVLNELYRDCNLKLSRKYNVYLERYCNGSDPRTAS